MLASDGAAIGRSTTALWQPAELALEAPKMESKKLVGLAACKGTSKHKKRAYTPVAAAEEYTKVTYTQSYSVM